MTYNPDGQLSTLTAKNSTTGDQVTRYVYGTAVANLTPEVFRNDLLRAEIYPDSDDTTTLENGTDGVYDRVEFKYNRQGEVIWKKDQNGTIHEFDYDDLGRQTQDRITTVGSGVDDAVLRLGTSYEVRGQADAITSYDNATAGSGSAVNQVVFEYDDVGLLSKEYQEHAGAKGASTLYVQYNHDTSASSGQFTKGLRPTSVRYPNGRLVHYTYGTSSGMGDSLNRLDAIKDDNGGSPGDTLASYSYLGQNTIVIEDYEEPEVRLEYTSTGGYGGFDRFGRVIDQKWYDYGASTDRDRFTYGYDRASNRIYRDNTIASGFDEFYTYDNINRLATFERGDLNTTKTAITGTPTREEDWSLDPTGNWTDYTQKTAGTTDLDQSRTQNTVNEITTITATTGTNWADPVHDRAGNMTTIPKPTDLANGLTAKYDAWNRLVEVKDGTVVIARYEYDSQNRRTKKHLDSAAPSSPNGLDTYIHYFHNNSWQTLETRQSTTASAQPETLQPKHQYLWSSRYIDAPVLRDENADQNSLCDDQRLYYLNDANFNVTALIDSNGGATERYIYDLYGKATIYNATWTNTRSMSSYNNVTLYTGRELDLETGLCHYRNRYCHMVSGRFTSRDPVGYEGGIGRFFGRDPIEYATRSSLYIYCSGNPVAMIDPGGLQEMSSGCCWGGGPPPIPDYDSYMYFFSRLITACKITIYGGHNYNVKDMIDTDYPDDDDKPGWPIPIEDCVMGVGCGFPGHVDGGKVPGSIQDFLEKHNPCNSVYAPRLCKVDDPIAGVKPKMACTLMKYALAQAKKAAKKMLKGGTANPTRTDCEPPNCDTVEIDIKCAKVMEDLIEDGMWKGQKVPSEYIKGCKGLCGKSITLER